MNLPARVDELSPEFQRSVAVLEFARLRETSAERIELSNYYHSRQGELAIEIYRRRPAYADRLYDVLNLTGMIGRPESDEKGVAKSVVSRQVMPPLHPDRDENLSEEKLSLYKQISNAQALNDKRLEQSAVLEALIMPRDPEDETLEELRQRRYLAHAALSFFRSKYKSKQTIDEDFAERLQLAPHRQSIVFVRQLQLGLGSLLTYENMVELPGHLHLLYLFGIEEVNATYAWTFDHKTTKYELELVDKPKATRLIESVISRLDDLRLHCDEIGEGVWDYQKYEMTSEISFSILKLAKLLRTLPKSPKKKIKDNQERLF